MFGIRIRPRRPEAPPAPAGPARHTIGTVSIALPADHRLPEYQADFALFDRFLPFLARRLSGPDLLVDIGANVGDTAVAIAQVCPNPILAIEPEPGYFRFLVDNLAQNAVRPGITPVQALVGSGGLVGQLVSDGTTAGLRGDAPGDRFQTLDAILARHWPDGAGVALVKVCVDGFAWDALASGGATLREFEPVLYWENHLVDRSAGQAFSRLYRQLEALGYTSLWIFDNFGALMVADATYAALESLNGYVASQEWGRASRTIWYTYVLAATPRRVAEARAAVADYRAFADTPER